MSRIPRPAKSKESVRANQEESCYSICPRCAGNKRILDFRSGDRATGEPAGWKAVSCPGCGGAGVVDAETAALITARMEQESAA